MARKCPELLADCLTTTNVGGSEDSSDDDDDDDIIVDACLPAL